MKKGVTMMYLFLESLSNRKNCTCISIPSHCQWNPFEMSNSGRLKSKSLGMAGLKLQLQAERQSTKSL